MALDDDDGVTAPPIGDQLDLHTFRADECADVVDEYVRAAHAAGLPRVRIIHGKGTGALRRTVHMVLERHELVASYRLADENWGATIAELTNQRGSVSHK